MSAFKELKLTKFKIPRNIHLKGQKYVIGLQIKGIRKYLGGFDDLDEAACTLMAHYQSLDINYYDIRKDSVFYYVKTKIQNVNPEDLDISQFFNYLFCYDYDTGKLYWKNNPTFIKRGKEAGYIGYGADKNYKWLRLHIGKTFKNLKVHRIIYTMVIGSIDKTKVIDHMDRNPLNNRFDNLRQVDSATNARNQKKPINNTSTVSGVNWSKCTKSWRAYISVGKKQFNLGSYTDFLEAVYARLFGEMCLDWDLEYSNTLKYIKNMNKN